MFEHSALYVGTVAHDRRHGPRHQFRYPLYMHLLDLEELPAVARTLRLFGHNRARPVSFRDADHLGDRGRPVAENLRAWVETRGVEWPGGRVTLLTHCRVFGYVFNPVSFFYLHDRTGQLAAIVAEVNNTFGERHCYLLGPSTEVSSTSTRRAWRDKKVFHVSPFFSLDGSYRFEMSAPGDDVFARIDLTVAGALRFRATLALERVPLDDRALARMLIRYPLMTARIMGAIHWEALKLWRKGVPFQSKPRYDPEAARRGVA
jgi:DUF1365 family protein